MKKFKFLFTAASLKSRILALIAVVLGVASILVVTSAVSTVVNGPLVKIPVIEMILPEDEMDSIGEGIDEMFNEIEKDPDVKEMFEEMFDQDLDELRDTMDIESVSLADLDTFFQGFFESDLVEGAGEDMSGVEAVKMIFSIIISVITIYAAVIAVFMGLSTLFLKKGLFIFAYILALPYYIAFVGTSSLVIATVLLIAYFVLVTIMNQEFKQWKYEQKMAKKAAKLAAKEAKKAAKMGIPVAAEAAPETVEAPEAAPEAEAVVEEAAPEAAEEVAEEAVEAEAVAEEATEETATTEAAE